MAKNLKTLFTPISIPIWVAALGFVFNLFINWYNTSNQFELEQKKFEYSIYLQSMKENDTTKAKSFLNFFVRLELLNNKSVLDKIKTSEIPLISNSEDDISNNYQDINRDELFSPGIKGNESITKVKILSVGNPWNTDSTRTEIIFNNDLPKLILSNTYNCRVETVGDLNNDNIQELAVVRYHIAGCWRQIEIFSLNSKKWVEVTSVTFYSCITSDGSLKSRIRKIGNNHYTLTGHKMGWNDKFKDSLEPEIVNFHF